MLREDVVAAVREGRFQVHAIDDVDHALALLTGVPAGAADARGRLPEGSVNQRVADRLTHLSQLRQAYGMGLERPPPQGSRARGQARNQREPARGPRAFRPRS
jgi:hypothetical protein